MVNDILEYARSQIERAKRDLESAKELVARLRKAGENVAEMEARIRELELKLKRYEEAFAE